MNKEELIEILSTSETGVVDVMDSAIYEREAEDYDDAGAFILKFSLMTRDMGEADVIGLVYDVIGGEFHRSCGCFHDCCGHVFSSVSEVLVSKRRNIYGDAYLKDADAWSVVFEQRYGYNV